MKLLFVGDVMLGRLVNDALKKRPADFPWGNTLPIFKEADTRICNLECVITDHRLAWSNTSKVFFFKTDSKNVEVLKAAEIIAVSNANNHSLDFRYAGMLEMLKILDKAKILHAGAGKRFREASQPAKFSKAGLKISFIAFTDNEPWAEATAGGAGIFYVPVDKKSPRAAVLFKIISQAKKTDNLVIVSAHWGPNWGYRPHPNHIPFAHDLIDAGADIIFGHSCHVFQAVEIYKGRPILYSTGDFIDDYAVDPIERNDQSFIFIIETQGDKPVKLYLHPTVIRNLAANLATAPEAVEIASKMQSLCKEFGTFSQWEEKEQRLVINIS